MKLLPLTVLAVLAAGCQSVYTPNRPLAFTGGDGSCCEQAVVIHNAIFRETGHLAERVWLDRNYPGRRENKQSDLNTAGKHYDLVELTTAEGRATKVYFDTTESNAR
jgi:hypothetical protein